MMELYGQLALILLVYASAWFGLSLWLKRNDVADVAWGLGYVLVVVFCLWHYPWHETALLVDGLVVAWALRLSLYIGLRNRGKTEDFRYKQWREEWGRTFYWRSWLQVYLLQAFLLLLISTPVSIAALAAPKALNFVSAAGAALWLLGFYWQAVADFQLAQFRKKRKHKDEVLQTGLWKYSRHPNYFGEVLMWWGIFIIVLPLPLGWLALISPVLITWLLVRVSGIPMLEARYKGNKAYQTYRAKTPALFPKLW